MNATVTLYALALASNDQPEQHFEQAYQHLCALGQTQFSAIYLIPCRDGVGADYWNAACLLHSELAVESLVEQLKALEQASGRVRPSHHISLDLDLIAWGPHLTDMQFNAKKLPLAVDVKIPLAELWQHPALQDVPQGHYPVMQFSA